MSDGQVISEGLQGKPARSESFESEIAEEMTGGRFANVEPIAFDYRNSLTVADIDETAMRAQYAAMSDEDLLAAAENMQAHLAGMAAYSSNKEKDLGKMRALCA